MHFNILTAPIYESMADCAMLKKWQTKSVFC